MKIRVLAPEPVKEYMSKNESIAQSGDHCRGEGGDYITENENHHLKSHLPPSVPILNHWVVAARNQKMLTDNRKNLDKRCGLTDPSSNESSVFKFDEEIQMLRLMIRTSCTLQDPYELYQLRSLDGELLHPDLVNFYYTCVENYHHYLEDPSVELAPVFASLEDEINFNDAKNWSNSKIISETELLINQFSDPEEAQRLCCFNFNEKMLQK